MWTTWNGGGVRKKEEEEEIWDVKVLGDIGGNELG